MWKRDYYHPTKLHDTLQSHLKYLKQNTDELLQSRRMIYDLAYEYLSDFDDKKFIKLISSD